MDTDDPRFATYPRQTSVAQLRWLIAQTAAGAISVDDLYQYFRPVHEELERAGRVPYASREEARLIWDVLWVLEFYSPDLGREENPEDWNTAPVVLAEVRRVAALLQ